MYLSVTPSHQLPPSFAHLPKNTLSSVCYFLSLSIISLCGMSYVCAFFSHSSFSSIQTNQNLVRFFSHRRSKFRIRDHITKKMLFFGRNEPATASPRCLILCTRSQTHTHAQRLHALPNVRRSRIQSIRTSSPWTKSIVKSVYFRLLRICDIYW